MMYCWRYRWGEGTTAAEQPQVAPVQSSAVTFAVTSAGVRRFDGLVAPAVAARGGVAPDPGAGPLPGLESGAQARVAWGAGAGPGRGNQVSSACIRLWTAARFPSTSGGRTTTCWTRCSTRQRPKPPCRNPAQLLDGQDTCRLRSNRVKGKLARWRLEYPLNAADLEKTSSWDRTHPAPGRCFRWANWPVRRRPGRRRCRHGRLARLLDTTTG